MTFRLPTKIKRGRQLHRATLTEAQVKEIRAKAARGVSEQELATFYRVTRPTIWKIVRHKLWKHIP